MLFLLYHKKSRPTGRAIAEALGIRHGTDPLAIPTGTTKVIRWGNAKRIAGNIPSLNSGGAIMLAGDKLETIKKLIDEGVPTLEYSVELPDWHPGGDNNFWFARKRRGFGGKDIRICNILPNKPITVYPNANNGRPLPPIEAAQALINAEFFTKFVDNTKEYRIHVAGGEIIRFQRKYPVDPVGAAGTSHIRVQNHANGYVFRQPARRLNADRFQAAKDAVSALGLDFGAVDLVVDRGGHPIVLEVNTAPSCSPKTLDAYVQAFRKEL